MSLKHSFPPIMGPDARILVLGSLPGDRSLAAQRYYAHPQNQFWHLMSPVVGRDLVALDYADRLAALRATGVALWDVIGSARRAGSSDAAIVDPQGNDIAALVAIIALPSSSPLHTVGLAAKQPAWSQLAAFLLDPT
jgi:hypoxanthine-DNA glycosylase